MMKNNALVKSLIPVLILAIIASVLVFSFSQYQVAYADTAIRPSATNSSKVPEIVGDPTQIKVEDGTGNWSLYLEFLDLTSYFDTLKDDYLTKEDPESHIDANKKSEIKISMHNDWTEIETKTIDQINANMTDELAKQVGGSDTYTKDNFEITYFFDLQIDEQAVNKLSESPSNFIKVRFKLLEVAPEDHAPIVLFRCHDTDAWSMISVNDVVNNGDYTVTVTFHELCSILFVQTKDIAEPTNPDTDTSCNCEIPWWIVLIIIAGILLLVFIIRIIVGRRDDDDDEDDKGPYKEEEPKEEENKETPIEEPKEEIPEENIEEPQEEAIDQNNDQDESSGAEKKYGDESGETPQEIEETNEEVDETPSEDEETPNIEDSNEDGSNDETLEEDNQIEEPQEEEKTEVEDEPQEDSQNQEELPPPPRKLDRLPAVINAVIASNASKKVLMNCTLAVASTFKRCKNPDDKKTVIKSIIKLLMVVKKK